MIEFATIYFSTVFLPNLCRVRDKELRLRKSFTNLLLRTCDVLKSHRPLRSVLDWSEQMRGDSVRYPQVKFRTVMPERLIIGVASVFCSQEIFSVNKIIFLLKMVKQKSIWRTRTLMKLFQALLSRQMEDNKCRSTFGNIGRESINDRLAQLAPLAGRSVGLLGRHGRVKLIESCVYQPCESTHIP